MAAGLFKCNFVKSGSLIQEITADGKVRDIVTEVKKKDLTEAEKREEHMRNLPEFKREREGTGASLSDQLAENKSAFEEDKEKEKPKIAKNIDEDDIEHYQMLEDRENAQKRKRKAEDTEAVVEFGIEKNKMLRDGADVPATDFISKMQQANRERAAEKERTAPSALDRLKGRVKVKARTEAEATPAPAAAPVQQAGGLVGYASDSDE